MTLREGTTALATAAWMAACLLLAACNLLVAGGSSSTETGEPVSLTGRVTGARGAGIDGVVVSLAGTALADTTDGRGVYRITGRVPRRTRDDATVDTLVYDLPGQTVARRLLTTLTDSLPDVPIVQRGFSGGFSGDDSGVARIEGVVTGDGVPPGDSVTATFYHNVIADNYSGFVWFPPPGDSVRTYAVHVNVYDAGDSIVGRSAAVSFDSRAGDITIPDFDPFTFPPPP